MCMCPTGMVTTRWSGHQYIQVHCRPCPAFCEDVVCVSARALFRCIWCICGVCRVSVGLFASLTKPEWLVVHLVLERTFALVNLVLRALNYAGAVTRWPAKQRNNQTAISATLLVNYCEEKLVRYLGTDQTESKPNAACLPTRSPVLFCIDTLF